LLFNKQYNILLTLSVGKNGATQKGNKDLHGKFMFQQGEQKHPGADTTLPQGTPSGK
jgi:hypothetical protein